ncbi:hypothetical protein M9H77_23831 [Catharanthus roseus]|uniref:Uncharacterized protein n=1 Tax=Catharanthus roseus TaxID=4058 RepID=A0ACC0AYJ2_CATRO|nr:hypothetical protein M9H77_23831 [Catharanthus roseus]
MLYGGNNRGIETSLLEDKLELVTSLLMLNFFSILLMMIMGVMEVLTLNMIIISIILMIVMKRLEDKGRNMEKELGTILEELLIILSLIPSLMCYEYYLSHASIYGDLCAISFSGGLFLVVSYASTCLSSHAFLEGSLLHSGSMFDPSSHDFKGMNNASNESIVVGFGLDGALFDILHDKCLGKFVENIGYVSPFLDTLVENRNSFISLNRFMSFMSGQVEFSCNEQKLSNLINSLNTLFENTFGFQFYYLLFKEFLLEDFESQTGVNL